MLPGYLPVFVRIRRRYDQLITRKFENPLQVFADERPDQRALNVKGEGMRVTDLIPSKRSFVAGLRVLHWGIDARCGWVPIHDLDSHVAVGSVDEQSCTVGLLNGPIRARLFEPDQAPCPQEAVSNVLSLGTMLSRRPRCAHTET